jgi:hypothetical protein
LRLSVTDNDGGADVLMQVRERSHAENYLVLLRDSVTGQDRRGQRGMAVCEQDGDLLAVDFDVVMVGSSPCGDVAVAVE